jgi:hypothetical protein
MASASEQIDQFYGSLQTLPRLISELALSIADAQTRLDRNYIDSLAAFSRIVAKTVKASKKLKVDDYKTLFETVAPSRYQFSETVVEVRADLQMASAKSLSVDASVGINAGVFAVALNASYTKRNSYDYRAAALIRTVLNAIPADANQLQTLLARGGNDASVKLPANAGIEALGESANKLLQAQGGDNEVGNDGENPQGSQPVP